MFYSSAHFQEVLTGNGFENVSHVEREIVQEEDVNQIQDTEEAGEQEASIMSKPDLEVRHQQHFTQGLFLNDILLPGAYWDRTYCRGSSSWGEI